MDRCHPSMEILPVIFGIHPEWIRYGKENLVAFYDKGGQGGILKGPVHLRLDEEGTWLFRAGDSPAWSQWHAGEDATVGHEEAQARSFCFGSGFGRSATSHSGGL